MSQASRADAVAQGGHAATYDGLYLRDNLASEGVVPAATPYNECPDIIQSLVPLADPEASLGTTASWERSYRTEPLPGINYYYARGMNGAAASFEGKMFLYWCPAELVLFPSLWKYSPMRTANGNESVAVSAAPGQIGVTVEPWQLSWPQPSFLSSPSTFASFIAQNTAVAIPDTSTWIEMSQLMIQQLSLGWRNTVTFDATAEGGMLQRMGLTIPGNVGGSGTLQIILSGTGLVGDTIALVADCYTADQKIIQIQPSKLAADGQAVGMQLTLEPGFHTNLTIQYWNTSGKVPDDGSNLTLTANYVIPKAQLDEALTAGIVDSRYSRAAANLLSVTGASVTPTPVAPLGAVTFIATSAG